MDAPEPICKVIPRTAKSEVRIQQREYKDRQFADIRVYRQMKDKETGEMAVFPTRKGISIPIEELAAHIEALQTIAAQVAAEAQVEADAGAEMEGRPPAKLCADCERDCKQWADVTSCAQYKQAGKANGRAKSRGDG